MVAQLGYLGFEVSDVPAWRKLLVDALGLWEVEAAPGYSGFGLDQYRHRILLRHGPLDDLAFVGFEAAADEALADLADRLPGARAGTALQAEIRAVDELIRFEDPAGNPIEVFRGPSMGDPGCKSASVASGFVAGELGLGHVVLTSRSASESAEYYSTVLGFRLSDFVRCKYFGHDIDLTFLHSNPRHHTLALGGPLPKRVNHFMVQSRSLDDVGACFDRCLGQGVPIFQTMGRHPNDQMVSFYATTPSGFNVEFGSGGRLIDDADWQPEEYDRISDWGHHPARVLASRLRSKR